MAVEAERFAAMRSRDQPGLWYLSGVIDENADLSFFESLGGPTKINMKDVRRINSYGVRAWMEGIRKVPAAAATQVEFVECSSATIDQANMVAGFLGRGRVVSFHAPMACSRCGVERDELFVTADYKKKGSLPDSKCPSCASPMLLNDLEDHYLLFARDG